MEQPLDVHVAVGGSIFLKRSTLLSSMDLQVTI